jgi:hypothetical protein
MSRLNSLAGARIATLRLDMREHTKTLGNQFLGYSPLGEYFQILRTHVHKVSEIDYAHNFATPAARSASEI